MADEQLRTCHEIKSHVSQKKKIKSHVVHMKQQHEIVNWNGSFKHRFIYLLVMWLR